MGNGSLIYGCTLTWAQVCDLIKKRIETDVDLLENLEIKQKLLQFRLYMEDKPRDWDYEAKKYFQEAAKIVTTTPHAEMGQMLQSIIDKYFAEDAFAPDSEGADDDNETKKDVYYISPYFKIIGVILNLDCCSHGACCNRDRDLPFVVGFACDGGPCRGEASGVIKMVTEDQKKKVDQVFSLIHEKAIFLINSDDCDSCT